MTTHHDWEGGEPLYLTVVSTVSAVLGVAPETLSPLADVFDPDAFEEFVSSAGGGPLRVQFEYHGCAVSVDSVGVVSVVPPAEE